MGKKADRKRAEAERLAKEAEAAARIAKVEADREAAALAKQLTSSKGYKALYKAIVQRPADAEELRGRVAALLPDADAEAADHYWHAAGEKQSLHYEEYDTEQCNKSLEAKAAAARAAARALAAGIGGAGIGGGRAEAFDPDDDEAPEVGHVGLNPRTLRGVLTFQGVARGHLGRRAAAATRVQRVFRRRRALGKVSDILAEWLLKHAKQNPVSKALARRRFRKKIRRQCKELHGEGSGVKKKKGKKGKGTKN